MDRLEAKARLDFRRRSLAKLQEAYLALLDGRVKSYVLEGREVTRLDLSELRRQILDTEDEIDELEKTALGGKPRKLVSVTPRGW